MRLWTLHPKHLDAKGLVAAWREALLAQAVIRGRTKGYRHHPQLMRFRASRSPIQSIGSYLRGLLEEARRRGYRFDGDRIAWRGRPNRLRATDGQLAFEWGHLRAKLAVRDRRVLAVLDASRPEAHPMFVIVAGGIAGWESRVPRGRTRRPKRRRASERELQV